MTEAKLITMSDDQWSFIKLNNIKLSSFVQDSIDHARCKHIVTIRPDQQEWLEGQHVNLDLLAQAAIDKEMNGHG